MVAPILADRMETTTARRIGFLASKLPRRPGLGMQIGPDTWRPSDFEIRKFARYAASVEDPQSVVERAANGSITPEDAEALREVYPEMFAEARNDILARLPELQKNLPYQKRLALSIFFGVPVDPAMTPQVLGLLQGNFAEEPGTDGGMQPPTAAPQFGSVSKPEPTAAQERAG